MALKITIAADELHDFLRIDSGDDAPTVNLLLGKAMGEAERFLNTDFSSVLIDGLDGSITIIEQEAPAEVKAWVFDRVAELYDNRGAQKAAKFDDLQPLRVSPFKGD